MSPCNILIVDMTNKVRVTFSCEKDLKEKLTTKAENQGIPRSQLIVELLEMALGAEQDGFSRTPEVNRFLFDIQQRLADLEAWRRKIKDWTESSDQNAENLETTLAALLNEQVAESGMDDVGKEQEEGKAIPEPKK